jgi:hypothetical protein
VGVLAREVKELRELLSSITDQGHPTPKPSPDAGDIAARASALVPPPPFDTYNEMMFDRICGEQRRPERALRTLLREWQERRGSVSSAPAEDADQAASRAALLSPFSTPSYPLSPTATMRAVVDSRADTSWVPNGCMLYASADFACAESTAGFYNVERAVFTRTGDALGAAMLDARPGDVIIVGPRADPMEPWEVSSFGNLDGGCSCDERTPEIVSSCAIVGWRSRGAAVALLDRARLGGGRMGQQRVAVSFGNGLLVSSAHVLLGHLEVRPEAIH